MLVNNSSAISFVDSASPISFNISRSRLVSLSIKSKSESVSIKEYCRKDSLTYFSPFIIALIEDTISSDASSFKIYPDAPN